MVTTNSLPQRLVPVLAGKTAQVQVLPESNTVGQQHLACKLLHSIKQAAFVFFYRVLEGGGKGSVLTPGTLEWSIVPEHKLGEEKSMVWTLPGKLQKTTSSAAIFNNFQEHSQQTTTKQHVRVDACSEHKLEKRRLLSGDCLVSYEKPHHQVTIMVTLNAKQMVHKHAALM